jgi:ppGpp synthetase/RelA/SpoT-type nucleotidyltranferase
MCEVLKAQYSARYENYLVPIAASLQDYLIENIKTEHIDSIRTRAKAIDSFVNKACKIVDGEQKYTDPLRQINDQIGGRIIVFYKHDVNLVINQLHRYFRQIEQSSVVPERFNSFGYESVHFLFYIPDDVIPHDFDRAGIPSFFELQVATLFQHAWAEANHNLAYKPQEELTEEEQRKIAFAAAQAWGADFLFDQISLE